MTINRTLPLTILFVLLAPCALAAPPLNPGRWEVTIKTESPVSMPPTTTEICITGEKAARPEPVKGKPTDDCKADGVSMNGNVLTYAVRCGKQKVSTSAKFTYSGDTYTGVVTIKSGKREIRQIHTARRVGNCDDPGQQ
jgi:Protein of unknown function (DUF3617)